MTTFCCLTNGGCTVVLFTTMNCSQHSIASVAIERVAIVIAMLLNSHHHHIRLINDLSAASITQHETHKTHTMAMAMAI